MVISIMLKILKQLIVKALILNMFHKYNTIFDIVV